MRVSLKLLLLLSALAAVMVAWIRARHDYAKAQFQILRNTDWNAETIAVPEATAPPSQLNIDAAGAVNSAYLTGPAGYAAIRNRAGANEQISGLTLRSLDAIALFDPSEFPNLTWLSLDDSFDIDYTTLSLAWLQSLRNLQALDIDARTRDPRPALATLPKMQPLKLSLWTDQVDSFDDFPQLSGLSMLELHVPPTSDTDAVLMTLQQRLSECRIVVWDNFRR